MNKWMQKALEQLTQLPAHVNETQKSEHEQQPADKPVAMRHSFDGYGWKYTDMGFGSNWKEWTLKQHPDAEPVYDRPRPAAWVGLTPEERNSIWKADQMTHKEWDALFDTVELKLKEKNGGGV